MVIRKSVHPQAPPIHPGLAQKLREAVEAEARGETPRSTPSAQKVLRPSLEASTEARVRQVRTIGLIDPAYRGADGKQAIAERAPFRPGVALDDVWDELGEAEKIRAGAVERFRLELEAALADASRPHVPPHKIGGRLDARNLRRAEDNIGAEIDALRHLLAEDARALLDRFVRETRELLESCLKQRAVQGLDAPTAYGLLRDLVHKLLYQELVSRGRGMGDRGIRRILGNVQLAEHVYAQLRRRPDFNIRDRLLMRITHVHQDLGFTAYAARVSFRGGKLHRAYGARIFTDEMNRYRPLLTHDELDQVRVAVATHSHEELPFSATRFLALVRAVDHLAPFAPHRVYKHLESLPGAADYLDDLLARARAGDVDRYLAAKEAFGGFLDRGPLAGPLAADILAAFRPFERQAELVDLGALAGEVRELRLDLAAPGVLTAVLEKDDFAFRYQALFDLQQEQLTRLASATGVSPEQLRGASRLRFAKPGSGALEIERA